MKLIIDDVLQVKVGDTVVYRNGRQELVKTVKRENGYSFPVRINDILFGETGSYWWYPSEEPLDIVAIIPATSPQSEPVTSEKVGNARNVDLTNAFKAFNERMKEHGHKPDDFVNVVPATSPQVEPKMSFVGTGTLTLTDEQLVTWNADLTHVRKPSRMIDLFAQGVEFVKDSNDDVWTYKDNAFHLFIRGAFLCQTGVSNLQRVIFNEATVAENPEKPKKVVYFWIYKRTGSKCYHTTLTKCSTEEEALKDLEFKTCYGTIEFIEKIEHSREEI